MRIVVLTPYVGDLFGQERVLRDSALLLRRHGHQVNVVTEHARGSVGDFDDVLEVKGSSGLNQLSSPRELRRVNGTILNYIEKVEPDVVHFLDQFDYRLTARLRKTYPTILSVHTVSPTCPASTRLIKDQEICNELGGYSCLKHLHDYGCLDVFRGVLRKFLVVDRYVRLRREHLLVDHVVAVSEYIRQVVIANGWEPGRVSVVYNPIKLSSVRALMNAPKNLITCVSRLQKIKGIEVLLKALQRVRTKEWELWLCGEGPEQRALKDLAEKLGMQNRVKFLGKTTFEETQQIVAASKIFVQANLAPEAFGLAAAEAAALGVPVLAANIPALNEVLADGGATFFPPGDFVSLANSIDAVLSENFPKPRATSAQMILERFNPDRHLCGMLEAYHSAIGHFRGITARQKVA